MNMRKLHFSRLVPWMLLLVAAATLASGPAVAQKQRASEPKSDEKLMKEVRHHLVMLPYFSVFDNLAYSVENGVVTLHGQVVQPTLKSDAEATVKDIGGVETVVNQIEVLPLSSNDDRLRRALFRSIYGFAPLQRYSVQAVPPIHIIVKHGHVTLVGVVATEGDRNFAGIRANSVAGVFSVQNDLQVEAKKKK
jgi:hyperosmotically inducible periplasmic protein